LLREGTLIGHNINRDFKKLADNCKQFIVRYGKTSTIRKSYFCRVCFAFMFTVLAVMFMMLLL